MSIVRRGDHVAVKKTRRGNYLAVLITDRICPQDDCEMFLFRGSSLYHMEESNALIAARRLLADIAPGQFKLTRREWWWDKEWRIYPVKES